MQSLTGTWISVNWYQQLHFPFLSWVWKKIFLNPQLFLWGFKGFHVTYWNRICLSTPIRIRCSIQDSSVTIVNRACAIRRASWRQKSNRIFVQRPYEINTHAVKTGSDFETSSDLKISGFDPPHEFKFNDLRIQNFPLWRAESKSWRIRRIRVDGTWIF